MALAIMGGLLVGTLPNLVFLPTLYVPPTNGCARRFARIRSNPARLEPSARGIVISHWA